MGELRESLFPPETKAPVSNALVQLKSQLAHLSQEAQAIRVSEFESSRPEDLDGLIKRTEALVATALEAVDIAAILFSTPEPVGEPDDTNEWDDRVSTPPIEADGISETVFLARLGLQSRRRVLSAALAHSSSWEQLACAGSAVRTIQKSLSAVERAISRSHSMPPSLSFYDHAVTTSLEVRRRYWELQRDMTRPGPPADHEVRGRLRSIGNAVTRLLGMRVASELRTEDRALLMMARSKVRDWLANPHDDAAHVEDGKHLWQDITSTATMFLEVNRREELVQHDALLTRQILRELPPAHQPWTDAHRISVIGRLVAMRGRNEALDLLLDAPLEAVSLSEVRLVLEGLDRSFGDAGVLAEADSEPPPGPRVRSTKTSPPSLSSGWYEDLAFS